MAWTRGKAHENGGDNNEQLDRDDNVVLPRVSSMMRLRLAGARWSVSILMGALACPIIGLLLPYDARLVLWFCAFSVATAIALYIASPAYAHTVAAVLLCDEIKIAAAQYAPGIGPSFDPMAVACACIGRRRDSGDPVEAHLVIVWPREGEPRLCCRQQAQSDDAWRRLVARSVAHEDGADIRLRVPPAPHVSCRFDVIGRWGKPRGKCFVFVHGTTMRGSERAAG